MLYLTQFRFPDNDREHDFIVSERRTCYDSFYPFQVLGRKGIESLIWQTI